MAGLKGKVGLSYNQPEYPRQWFGFGQEETLRYIRGVDFLVARSMASATHGS